MKSEMESEMKQLSFEEEEGEWERAEGIPQLTDPFIQKFFQGRDGLILQEDKHRSDRDFRDLLSPMAMEACAIVGQIRFEEQQTIWTIELEEEIAQSNYGIVYPGQMFHLAKERMEQTKLWKIVQRMPKGALLHCHLEAMVDVDWLFHVALETDGMHITAPEVLHIASQRENVPFTFQYAKQSSQAGASIWSKDYCSNTLVSLADAAGTFPGGKEAFIKWLTSRCTVGIEESVNHHHGANAIWRKFTSVFAILKTLIYYEPIYRKFLAHMFRQLLEDGVQYVDVRAAFLFQYRKEGCENPEEDYQEMMRVFGEEIKKFQASEEGKSFWGARIIWTSIRSFSNRAIVESMNYCIETKLAYPDLIAGFDLVGQEDLGRSLADLTPLLFWFRKQCATAGVIIPFFFHAGETCGTGTETDHNPFDAILLGTRRIGHGFSLYKHPLLMNMVRDKRLLVECCPISNEVLRLTSSISSHPLPALLAQGVPVALCNDDPAILGQGTTGMTHDFWQALQGIESLGLEGLGSLAENSVRWSAFEDLEGKEWTEDVKNGAYSKGIRGKRMKEWKREWEQFCQWVIVEFGADLDMESEE